MPVDQNTLPRDESKGCDECVLHHMLARPAIARRAFLHAAGLQLASLGLLGLGPRGASAMDLRRVRALDRDPAHPEERRYPLPSADGVSIDRDNSVIVARAARKVYAFSLACPHQNTALRWEAADHQFWCPKHKSHYRADGTFIEGRATRDMDRLALRRDGAELVVDVDTLYQEDLHGAQWSAAFIAV